MAMLSASSSAVARSPFCRPEDDSFLLLESKLRSLEEILRRSRGLPLHRTWIELPMTRRKSPCWRRKSSR
jgi:hypothetical protein